MEYVYSNKPCDVAADQIAVNILTRLDADEKVLWLTSGGSGIELAVQVAKKLHGHKLSNLSMSLVDERYGKIGHANENWRQLVNAGFKLDGAEMYRPLIDSDINDTTEQYQNWITRQLDRADHTIGVFGIGADGHTAGIKPGSKAVDNQDLVTCFSGDDYERITITPKAIRRLDEVIIYAIGDDKRKVLFDLLNTDMPISVMPAQILKEVLRVNIYTNNQEEELNL